MKPERNSQHKDSIYKTVWRWHFYAGIMFIPFLLILAVTGAIYIFKPQIEQNLYRSYYEVVPYGEKILASEEIDLVKDRYPDAVVTKYKPGENEKRSSEIGIDLENETYTVFVNPYTGKVIGKINDKQKIMNQIEKLHGELMVGRFGDFVVELVACWSIVLIITGIYLWLPKNHRRIPGVLFIRFTKGKKVLARDLHAVPAFWIAAGMLFLILTGLPRSGFWGNTFQSIVTNSGEGYPPSVWVGESPSSTIKAKDVAEVPWSAGNLNVPVSNNGDFEPLSIDDVILIAKREGIFPGYTIYYTVFIPNKNDGVYTLSVFPPKAQDGGSGNQ